ncbi:MAG: hypothetical protein ACP5RD_06090, partial [bacterium]
MHFFKIFLFILFLFFIFLLYYLSLKYTLGDNKELLYDIQKLKKIYSLNLDNHKSNNYKTDLENLKTKYEQKYENS